jgi:hypothetical protein
MGLRDVAKRWTKTLDELDRERRDTRFCTVDVARIADADRRVPIRLCGEVQALQVVPRAGSPSLEVTIGDGTGRAVAVFTGRRRIAGIEPGRGVVIDGVAGEVGGRLQLLNPAYTLLPS